MYIFPNFQNDIFLYIVSKFHEITFLKYFINILFLISSLWFLQKTFLLHVLK